MLSSSSSSKPRSSPLIQEGTPPTLEKNILSTFLRSFSKESSTWGIPSHQDEAARPPEGPTMCRPQNTLVKECFVRSSKTLQAQQEMSLTWETGDKNEDKLHLQLLPRFLVSNYQKLNPYLTWPRMVLRETATIIVNISNWEKYFFFWKIHFSIWINTFWFFYKYISTYSLVLPCCALLVNVFCWCWQQSWSTSNGKKCLTFLVLIHTVLEQQSDLL